MWSEVLLVENDFSILQKERAMTINTTINSNSVTLYLRTKIDSNEIMIDIFVNEVPLFYNLLPVLNEGMIRTRIICDYFDGDFVFLPTDAKDSGIAVFLENFNGKISLYYGFRDDANE